MKYKIAINKWIRWGYAIIFGVVFNFILDIIFSLVYRNVPLFQPAENYLLAVISTVIVFEILFWINHKMDQKLSWDKHLLKRFMIQLSLNSFIAILIVDGIRWTGKLVVNDFYYIRLLDEIIIIGLILFIVLAYVIIHLSIFLLNKWRFSLAELERFKKENAEFRFESLRSQVNPHFLFNSLNTLSALVYENPEKAEQFIRELSDVYRYILENRENELVQLENELAVARSYIFLNRIRFGKNLVVDFEISKSSKQLMIAPLTLQLLIENAIKHNVISTKRPLYLTISLENNKLVVKNNLQKKEVKEYSSGLGLKNIKSRYGFLTDENVDIEENDTEFIVRIPLITNG